jgi:hypothetical protein
MYEAVLRLRVKEMTLEEVIALRQRIQQFLNNESNASLEYFGVEEDVNA